MPFGCVGFDAIKTAMRAVVQRVGLQCLSAVWALMPDAAAVYAALLVRRLQCLSAVWALMPQ